MRKGQTVIGQDVVSLSDGVRIQEVKDLIINEPNDAVIALLVDEGGLMASSKIIPVQAVDRFGPSAVMVQDSSVVIDADDDSAVSDILDRDATLLDRKVLTRDGDELGSIKDMYFDEASGAISGFEVSGGQLDDVLKGTSFLRLDEIEVVGPDAVITRTETKAYLEEQKGGLQGALESAQAGAQKVGDRAQEVGAEARGKAEELGGQAKAKVDEASEPDSSLVGRRARRDVADRSGSIIVANGQRIDQEDVERARDAGVTDDLYAAVGERRQKSAREQAEESAQRASESAGDLWDRFTTRLSELTDEAGQKVDAQQTKRQLAKIHDAIGRPVTKVILDRDDEVILDVGDLVTHQAVQRAHENDMLETLLDSVYVAEVTFDRDELGADIPGESRVEEASGGAEVMDDLKRRQQEAEGDEPAKDDDPDRAEAEEASADSRAGATTSAG